MKKKQRYSKKQAINSILNCCVDRLLKEAKENYKIHPERTARYLSLVMKFIKRYRLNLSQEKRLKFCKKCFVYWIEGDTLRLKLNKSLKLKEHICINCNYIKRIPYGKQ